VSVRIVSLMATGPATAAVVAELEAGIARSGLRPQFVYAFYDHEHDDRRIAALLARCCTGSAVVAAPRAAG
jgi:hypothetical protein